MKDEATVRIFRFDPMVDKQPRYETYRIAHEAWYGLKVIDVLRYIYQNFDSGLSFRETCCQHICGGCIITVNGKPVLACEALSEKEMSIEPFANHQVLKDLIVEF